jgi:hypothetical protein
MGLPGRPPTAQFPALLTKQDTGCSFSENEFRYHDQDDARMIGLQFSRGDLFDVHLWYQFSG